MLCGKRASVRSESKKRVRRRGALHALGEVDGFAQNRALADFGHAQICHRHETGIQTDAHLNWHRPIRCWPHFARFLHHLFAGLERLDRFGEISQHAIADKFIDGAAVIFDDVVKPPEMIVQNAGDLNRRQAFGEFGEADKSQKQIVSS